MGPRNWPKCCSCSFKSNGKRESNKSSTGGTCKKMTYGKKLHQITLRTAVGFCSGARAGCHFVVGTRSARLWSNRRLVVVDRTIVTIAPVIVHPNWAIYKCVTKTDVSRTQIRQKFSFLCNVSDLQRTRDIFFTRVQTANQQENTNIILSPKIPHGIHKMPCRSLPRGRRDSRLVLCSTSTRLRYR